MIRAAGVLMPISSLPSAHGFGTMGKAAREFVDFLADSGQTYWQMLPLGPTGFGNSPYQCLSSYAGNPYFIDLDELKEDGLLTAAELKKAVMFKTEDEADYGLLYKERIPLLRRACARLPHLAPEDYFTFLEEEKHWVKDYAVFMAIKQAQKGKTWVSWPEELRIHDSQAVCEAAAENREEVVFWLRVQYLFYKQLKALKAYCEKKGIRVIGDLPFYVASDSVDVWSHPEQFEMKSDHTMAYVSGMPVDGANPEGQKWGNPLFDWNRMRSEGYRWWLDRAMHQFRFCDVLRIDHFRGYQSYFAVPADGHPKDGRFEQGPGLELFRKLDERSGKRPLLLEDLGHLTPDFLVMVRESGYPGMRILQYAFDPNDPGSLYMPFQYDHNTAAYTGTHDNNTLKGWYEDKNEKKRIERAKKYFGAHDDDDLTDVFLRGLYGSVSDLAIVPMQDLLGLGSEARFNDPSGNGVPWTWRMLKGSVSKSLTAKLKEMMLLYCRNNWEANKDENAM